MATLAHSPTNDHREADFMRVVDGLAKGAAAGPDSLPKLGYAFADAVHNGTFSMDKDPETGKDCVDRVYERYAKKRADAAVHEHNAGSLKAQVSKLRQIGLAAAKPTCDFPATLAKLSIVHQEMQAKAKETGIKPRSTYNAQTEAARTQTKQDDDLTDEQILAICRKPDPKDKTELGEVERAEKILDGLVSGESGLGHRQGCGAGTHTRSGRGAPRRAGDPGSRVILPAVTPVVTAGAPASPPTGAPAKPFAHSRVTTEVTP
jgi:hypothetical protein